MPKSSSATFCIFQHFHFLPFSLFIAGNYHLCNALPVFYYKVFSRKIDYDYPYFSTIISINRTWSIQ